MRKVTNWRLKDKAIVLPADGIEGWYGIISMAIQEGSYKTIEREIVDGLYVVIDIVQTAATVPAHEIVSVELQTPSRHHFSDTPIVYTSSHDGAERFQVIGVYKKDENVFVVTIRNKSDDEAVIGIGLIVKSLKFEDENFFDKLFMDSVIINPPSEYLFVSAGGGGGGFGDDFGGGEHGDGLGGDLLVVGGTIVDDGSGGEPYIGGGIGN